MQEDRMAIPDDEEEAVDVPMERPRFFIDVQWYADHNRSFLVVAQERMCKSCEAKLGTDSQERVPTVDERTGRIIFELRSTPFGANPMSVIRSCCAHTKDYITIETPVMEAIFRVFLANGNQPSDIPAIREQLSEYIPLSARPQVYVEESLERLIRADNYYGLREFRVEV